MFRDMGELENPADAAALESSARARLIEQLRSGEYVGWLAEQDATVIGGAGALIHQYHPSPQNLRGRPTAYVCERGQCRLPAIAPEKLASQIAPVRPYR